MYFDADTVGTLVMKAAVIKLGHSPIQMQFLLGSSVLNNSDWGLNSRDFT